MKITVLGWYGTETIGDRAILAGLLHLFSEASHDDMILHLGSLCPVLSHRTWLEDNEFYVEITNGRLKDCNVFYSLNANELKNEIKDSDWVVMGGGPLIDIDSLYMLLYAFKNAKKRGIRTSLFGCGWETLSKPDKIECVKKIVELSDLTIFRDSNSAKRAYSFINNIVNEQPLGLLDPAFFAAQYFRTMRKDVIEETYAAVNFRHLFVAEKPSSGQFSFEECLSLLRNLASLQEDLKIRLIPMHTFFKGGDDRVILNRLCMALNNPRVAVQNVPLSLEDTMSVYRNAQLCVGMRFHSIVLQTVLNGKNYILDYTDPNKGKIYNMLNELQIYSKLKGRYLHPGMGGTFEFDKNPEAITPSDHFLNEYKEKYVQSIKVLLK